ncbi:hypothetical protein LCGC14_0367880 [marine sediment metagenome]|uniref:Desulfoferrodoxin ferrous iron-binding domain-containing protein n=1 Tax=marine sediment metagenome TaxID=412755 RepID=A0A0F9TP08_9ZZZZ|nr:hypothetical protein [Phycisphaerae bacterium]HDZ42726.1 hypothetical protein [Phycisphaerae bacterium]
MPWDKLFGGVNKPADAKDLTDLEKKHLPVLCAPDSVKAGACFEVVVEVGKLLAHPNENGHFIEFVELYADDIYLARADLTAVTTCPSVRFNVSLPGAVKQLRAFARCNLHGVWVSAMSIAVKE